MRFIDMFCGIGGFRLGLERANKQIGKGRRQVKSGQARMGFGCVWANDNDRYACQVYRKHFGELHEGDIRTVDINTIPEHDLLCAGFPCQSFSIAGKRGGFEDTRGTLFFEICRVLRAKRPSYIFLENVKGLLSHDDGATFQTIIRTLDELGYDCQWQVLNSKDYRVPQNRERVFIIGHLRGKPRPKVFPIGETGGTDKELKFLYGAISEDIAMWLDNGKKFSRNYPQGQRVYSADGLSAQLNAEAGGWGAKTGLYEVLQSPKIEVVAQGKKYPRKLKNGKKRGGDSSSITSRVYSPEGLSVGLMTQERVIPQIADTMAIRRLTPLECERLQGFPEGWTEGISDTQRYKCLGNAVTVNVIEAIGRQLWS